MLNTFENAFNVASELSFITEILAVKTLSYCHALFKIMDVTHTIKKIICIKIY